jgi:cytochrome P450
LPGSATRRAEAQIAIATLLERFHSLQVDPEHNVEHKRAPVFNGLEALWVRAA